MERLAKIVRTGPLLALLAGVSAFPSLAYAGTPEAQKKADEMAGKTFKCLAIGKTTPDQALQAARIYFETSTGCNPEASGMVLKVLSGPIGPLGNTEFAVEKKVAVAPKAPAIPGEVEAMIGKTFNCLALGGKKPEEAAEIYFKTKFGLSPKEAGVTLAIVSGPTGPLGNTVARVERVVAEKPKEPFEGQRRVGPAPVSTIAMPSTQGGATPAVDNSYIPKPEIKVPQSLPDEEVLNTGHLDSLAAVQDLWNRYLRERIRLSYDAKLKRNPNFGGKFLIVIKFNAKGQVTSVFFKQDTFKDKAFTKEVAAKIRGIRISEQLEPVEVELPIVFTPPAL